MMVGELSVLASIMLLASIKLGSQVGRGLSSSHFTVTNPVSLRFGHAAYLAGV